jgi:hypothetical protein
VKGVGEAADAADQKSDRQTAHIRREATMFAQTKVSLLRKPALVIALIAGSLLASSTTASAAAKSDPDPGVRCAARSTDGSYVFYLPGERATDVNGNKWVCGIDGMWFRDYSSLTTVGTSTGGTRYPTHVVAQVVSYAVMR